MKRIVPYVEGGKDHPTPHPPPIKGRVGCNVVFGADLVGFGVTLACVLAVSLTSGCMQPNLHGYNNGA